MLGLKGGHIAPPVQTPLRLLFKVGPPGTLGPADGRENIFLGSFFWVKFF